MNQDKELRWSNIPEEGDGESVTDVRTWKLAQEIESIVKKKKERGEFDRKFADTQVQHLELMRDRCVSMLAKNTKKSEEKHKLMEDFKKMMEDTIETVRLWCEIFQEIHQDENELESQLILATQRFLRRAPVYGYPSTETHKTSVYSLNPVTAHFFNSNVASLRDARRKRAGAGSRFGGEITEQGVTLTHTNSNKRDDNLTRIARASLSEIPDAAGS